VSTTDSEKYIETIAVTNGEMILTLARVFNLDPESICRWAVVVTSHVPDGEHHEVHDIRVASNCTEDADTRVLLQIGKASL
jgi:hypothetical protein